MTESESDKETLAHWVIAVRHGLERRLFIVDLLVLGHVGLVAEVVEVAGVGLRVQLGDEGRTGGSEGLPVYLGEVLVVVDVLDVREALGARVDASVIVSRGL